MKAVPRPVLQAFTQANFSFYFFNIVLDYPKFPTAARSTLATNASNGGDASTLRSRQSGPTRRRLRQPTPRGPANNHPRHRTEPWSGLTTPLDTGSDLR